MYKENNLGFEHLHQWLIKEGAVYNNLEITDRGNEFREVIAKNSIPKDRVVMSIPDTCIMSLDKAEAFVKTLPDGIKVLDSFMYHDLIALYLIYERRNPDSHWKPYIATLPTKFENIPLFYPENKLVRLKNTICYDMAKKKTFSLITTYKQLSDLNLFKFSMHEFIWARTAVITRVFGYARNGKNMSGLVPLADMLNHDGDSNTSWGYVSKKSCFELRSTNWIIKSRSVLDSYGSKCNSRFFVNYGFTLPDNQYWNECIIFLDCPSELKGYVNKNMNYDNRMSSYNILRDPSLQNICRFQIPRISTYNLKISQTNIQHLFSFLRLLAMYGNGDDLPSTKGSVTPLLPAPVSIENETKAMSILEKVLRDRLDKFETTLEEDTLALEKIAPYTEECNITRMIQSEKEVLHWYLTLCEMMISRNYRGLKKHCVPYYNMVKMHR
jgi:histone-lysine N-methyltransferase SETD3